MSLRLSLFTPVDALRQRYGSAKSGPDLGKRYNIAPGQEVAVLLERHGTVHLARRAWGLIPANAHHAAVGAGLYQVRWESLLELAAMRERLEQRRCAVLADGFFLWQESPEGAQPWYLYLASREPFALVALWELWAPAREDPIRSCAIVTAPANQRVAPIHQRMPVILTGGALATWLDSGIREPDALLPAGSLYVTFNKRRIDVATRRRRRGSNARSAAGRSWWVGTSARRSGPHSTGHSN